MPLAGRVQTRAMQVSRLARRQSVLHDGPLVLGRTLGSPDGRWHAEVALGTRAAMEARLLLSPTTVLIGLSQPFCVSVVVLGISVLQSWLFVHDVDIHVHTWGIMEVVKEGCASPPQRCQARGAHRVGKPVFQ